jgi:hypothetical protein
MHVIGGGRRREAANTHVSATCDAMLVMNSGANPATHDRLRERLIELRAEMLGRMVRKGAVEPGHLPLIAGVNAALDALGGMATEAELAGRVAVSDDGTTIRLTLYSERQAVAMVDIEPLHALALAGRLITAALARLSQLMEGASRGRA